MEFDKVITGRRSIRGYLKKPVPKALIREILELAMRAPTSLNTQPWNFYVVAGAVLDRIRAGNVERNLAGVPHSREFRMGPGYDGAHRERQIGVAKQLFAAMGIARDDKAARDDWVLRGFRQFDAPVSIVITYDRVDPRQRHRAVRLRRRGQLHRQRRLVTRPGLRHQQPGHHAEPGGAGRSRHPRRPGDPDLHRHGLARRQLPRQCGGVAAQVGGRGGGVPGFRRLTARHPVPQGWRSMCWQRGCGACPD